MKNIILIISIIAAFTSCDRMLLGDAVEHTPENVFNTFWTDLDEYYGLFQVKHINWDSVRQVYEPQIRAEMTDEELYHVLTEMLGILNDCHVNLFPSNPNLPMYQSGILGRIDTLGDFDLEMIKTNYLPSFQETYNGSIYGFLDDEIGYVHIAGFGDYSNNLDNAWDDILNEMKDTKGMIIDIRGGYGGEDLAGQIIGSRFADQNHLYMKTRIKNGAGENDFTPFQDWYLEPSGDFQYTKPVIILTHRGTLSARETFGLAMKALPNTTFLGDTTAGGFSNIMIRDLPNGWGYVFSMGDWRDGEGVSHETIGLIPDEVILNESFDIRNGTDKVLEEAISKLQ